MINKLSAIIELKAKEDIDFLLLANIELLEKYADNLLKIDSINKKFFVINSWEC